MDRSIAPTFETRLPQALAGEQSDALSSERGCRRRACGEAPPVVGVSTGQRLIVAHSVKRPPSPSRGTLPRAWWPLPAAGRLPCTVLPILWSHHPRLDDHRLFATESTAASTCCRTDCFDASGTVHSKPNHPSCWGIIRHEPGR
jgi:hypothetical protein